MRHNFPLRTVQYLQSSLLRVHITTERGRPELLFPKGNVERDLRTGEGVVPTRLPLHKSDLHIPSSLASRREYI